MTIAEESLQDLQARLRQIRATIASLQMKLASVPHSEQRVTDRSDLERAQLLESALQTKIGQLEAGQEKLPAVVGFVNREREMQQLASPTRPQFVVVEAPAGYGKTYLLRRIQHIINDRSANETCLYTTVPPYSGGAAELVAYGAHGQEVCRGHIGSVELVRQLVGQMTAAGIDEGTVLFDAMEHLPSGTDEARSFWDGLIQALAIRLDGHVQFRAVFSGRRVESVWRGMRRHRLGEPVELAPFGENAVAEAMQYFAVTKLRRKLPQARLRVIAREVVHITGGHPRAILGIAQEFATQGFALDLLRSSPGYAFSETENRRIVAAYIEPAIAEIYAPLSASAAHAMKTLSVFRVFNANVISVLIGRGLIASNESATTLLVELSSRTCLVSKTQDTLPFYHDAIVRLMTASWMRVTDPQRYMELTTLAVRLYAGWARGVDLNDVVLPIQPSAQLRLHFIREAIYHTIDTHRIGPTPPKLKDELTTLMASLSLNLVGDYETVTELQVQLQTLLDTDVELWEVLSRVAGDDVAGEFLDAVMDGSVFTVKRTKKG